MDSVETVEADVTIAVTESVVGEVIVVVDTVDVDTEAEVTVAVTNEVSVVSNVDVVGALTVEVWV